MRSSSIDVLTDLLQRSRARGAAFTRMTLHGPWGLQPPTDGTLAVHAIVAGEMYAWTDDPGRAIKVVAGDVVLLRASRHHLASSPAVPTRRLVDVLGGGAAPRRMVVGGPEDGPVADFCCGAYLFDGDLSAPLVESLPGLVRLRPAAGSPLRATIDLLVAEMAGEGPGHQALLDRLLDVALVQALRLWFEEAEVVPGWFRAMHDPGLAASLRAMHADPAHPWTVAQLAATAALSRSGFARLFRDVVGVAPLQYLTDWRIALPRSACATPATASPQWPPRSATARSSPSPPPSSAASASRRAAGGPGRPPPPAALRPPPAEPPAAPPAASPPAPPAA